MLLHASAAPETVLQKVGSENLNWRAGSVPEKITGATIGVHANPAHHGHALSLCVAPAAAAAAIATLDPAAPCPFHAAAPFPKMHVLNVVHMLLVQELGA